MCGCLGRTGCCRSSSTGPGGTGSVTSLPRRWQCILHSNAFKSHHGCAHLPLYAKACALALQVPTLLAFRPSNFAAAASHVAGVIVALFKMVCCSLQLQVRRGHLSRVSNNRCDLAAQHSQGVTPQVKAHRAQRYLCSDAAGCCWVAQLHECCCRRCCFAVSDACCSNPCTGKPVLPEH